MTSNEIMRSAFFDWFKEESKTLKFDLIFVDMLMVPPKHRVVLKQVCSVLKENGQVFLLSYSRFQPHLPNLLIDCNLNASSVQLIINSKTQYLYFGYYQSPLKYHPIDQSYETRQQLHEWAIDHFTVENDWILDISPKPLMNQSCRNKKRNSLSFLTYYRQ